MFNPLVDSFSELTDTQVEDKVNQLSKKYFQVSNPHIQMQIANILDMYKSEIQTRRAIAYQKQNDDNGDNGLDNLININ